MPYCILVTATGPCQPTIILSFVVLHNVLSLTALDKEWTTAFGSATHPTLHAGQDTLRRLSFIAVAPQEMAVLLFLIGHINKMFLPLGGLLRRTEADRLGGPCTPERLPMGASPVPFRHIDLPWTLTRMNSGGGRTSRWVQQLMWRQNRSLGCYPSSLTGPDGNIVGGWHSNR